MNSVSHTKLKLIFVVIIVSTLHKLDPYQYYVEMMKTIPHFEKA